MENIAIQTSQNIAIEQPIASVGERIAATAIDYAIFIGYIFLIAMISGIMQVPQLMAILMVPLVFYHLFMELAMDGQSWGKKVMKIRVVKIDGTQPGFLAYFLRWIFRLIDIGFFFGSISVLTIIINGKGQRLGDIAANTTIIRIKNSKVADTLYTRLPDDFEISFPEVKKLVAEDLYTVKEVIQFLKKSGRSMEAMIMADKTKKVIQKKMGIQKEMRSENFLFTVLRDYNYLHSK